MRCFVQPTDWNRPDVVLDDEEAHHLLQVMRAVTGDRIAVFNGAGETGTAEVLQTRKSSAVLRILERRTEPPDRPRLALAQALLREQKMDIVIQKAVELGVSIFQPLLTEHCVVRVKSDRADDKLERWRKIALGAAKQSGAARLPAILPPVALGTYLQGLTPAEPVLVGSLAENSRPFPDVLQKVLTPATARIAVMIGPEGDFSPAEMRAILDAGVYPVTFGRLVLRAETAAIFALSILRYETDRRTVPA